MSHELPARICLLGKPALFVDGRVMPFGGPRKAIALLAYLLLHKDRVLMRASIAEQFWPDEEDEHARASLRRHLHRALSALPEAPPETPWVIGDKVTLRWNTQAALDSDTSAYERSSATGMHEDAVALYRGDYLDGFYDDWVVPERERLRALQGTNLVALIEQRRRDLDYPAAIAYAQALSRLDPLREDAIRRLMSLRFAAGDRSGALAEFETFAARLRDELATDPMPETLALRESIRNNTLDLRPHAIGTSESAREVRSAFSFAGRASALRALRDAWEGAARGRAMTAIVSGEAGIGKSRLIGELVALAEAQAGRIAFGTTATVESEPYQPFAEALSGALALLRADAIEPLQLAALASLVPALRDLPKHSAPLVRLEPERDRQRLFDAVERAFELLAEKRPLLIVLEDLHWAGAATIDLLEFLVRRLREKSVLLVVSFREEDNDGSHALRAFLRKLETGRSVHIALGPLAEDDIRTIVASATRTAETIGERDRTALASELFATSDGNALFATELLRERLAGTPGDAIPAGISETVVARMNRLSSRARSLVEAAAIAGAGFDTDVLRSVTGWSFAEVFDALDELLDRALVRSSTQRRGDFAFSHQIVHAAIYRTIDDTTRRRLHRRMAKTLERLFPDRPALRATVARHYDRAELSADAVTNYLAAARYALALFSQADTIALASRALELCDDPDQRFELLALREEAFRRSADDAGREADCCAMLEVAERCAGDENLGRALSRTIARHRQLGERAAEHEAILRLRELGERSGSARWKLEAALARARVEINRSNLPAAEAIFHESEPLAADAGDDELALEFWVIRANTALGTPRAREFLDRAKPFIAGRHLLEVRWLRAQANVADFEGDSRTLYQTATELLERYLEMGDLDGQASAHLQLALGAWHRIDVAAVHRHNERALELFERVNKRNSIAAVLVNRGIVCARLGDFDAAEAEHRRALSIAQAIEQRQTALLALINLSWIDSMRGDHERAHERALEAAAYAREHGLEAGAHLAGEYLGRAERDLGRFEQARDHLERALQHRRARDPGGALATLIEIIPAYIALGDAAKALHAAEELLAGLQGGRLNVTFPARALWVASRAYAAAGDDERAQSLRTAARAKLRELSERIEDERSRKGYLSLRFHQEILAGT